MHSFDNMPCIGHLENIGSPSSPYLQMLPTSLYSIKKYFINITDLSETSLTIEKLSS